MIKKLGLIIFTLLLIFSVEIVTRVAYATESNEINKKLEQQNKDIKENMKDMNGYGDGLDDVLSQYKNNQENSSGEFNKEELMNKIENSIIKGVISLRTYSIYTYVVAQFIVTILISTIGAKSLEKRKLYVVFSITLTVLFLLFLNLPVIIIYFQNRAVEEIVADGGMLNSLASIISFLKENSPVIAMLLVTYGLINITLSKKDLPKRMQGKYMIKLAAIVFLVMQILPIIIKFIV